ncbi:hypothetical protein Ccrd_006308 [Cynara cardunculus var. scolymus]|uniref:Protein kinase domain-containing protein n=1 Tax=Cynara cardunculus var. scolymus TaxID=59895 RepID=A0A103XJ71_CYNCS|nr:hypothetical protein Ccrd_006308 [Cynara cardunculus var. scolymus]
MDSPKKMRQMGGDICMELKDVRSATNNFGDKPIGKGGFGKVYKGQLFLAQGPCTVAFKCLDRKFGQGDTEFWKEIMMLSKLRHQNLVSLLCFCNDDAERIIVYEYASRGSLDRYLGDASLTWTQRLQICHGAACGLNYLHDPMKTQQRILHRDIKSSNILLDEKWNAKVSDFGLSKIGPANQPHTYLISNVIGTPGYCDPLYWEVGLLSKESDVYSFGVNFHRDKPTLVKTPTSYKSKQEFHHLQIQLKYITSATDNFSIDKLLGRGPFGPVYKGELYLQDGRSMVACKRLDRSLGRGNTEFWREVKMLSKYKHENLISLLGFCDESDERILVYEYAPRGTLGRYLSDTNLTWVERLKICIGVARALSYLHDPVEIEKPVIHRDVKSAIILLDENWTPKVTDFGLSKIGLPNEPQENIVGTIGYCDPSYWDIGFLSKESDVYSFGVVLFEVMCGRLCFEYGKGKKIRILVPMWKKYYEEKRLDDIIYHDLKEQTEHNSLYTFSAIAYRCLKKAREERPPIAEVVKELEIALEQQTCFHMIPYKILRFSNVVRGVMHDGFKVEVKTQFLLPRITYTVNLVFKHSGMDHGTHIPFKFKFDADKCYSNACISHVREDGWLMIELRQFTSYRKEHEFKIEFLPLFRISSSTIQYFIDGIEFRPVEYYGMEFQWKMELVTGRTPCCVFKGL